MEHLQVSIYQYMIGTLIFVVFRVVSPTTACHDGDETTILVERMKRVVAGITIWTIYVAILGGSRVLSLKADLRS